MGIGITIAVSKTKSLEAAFLLPKNFFRRVGIMLCQRKRKVGAIVYWSVISAVAAVLICVQPVLAAETMWDRFSAIMRDFYGRIITISTIVAVTAAAVALIVRMVSRNQRAVEEATSWIKRIIVTWIILNSLGFIVAYIQPLLAGGNFTG